MLLVACAGPLDELDLATTRLIERQQDLTLGPDAPRDPLATPSRTAPADDGQAYVTRPPTVNPPASALPVTADPDAANPAADIDRALEQALAPPGALVFGLEDVLGYAIEHAREYRGEKELLFLTALDLLAQRHLWGPRFFDTVTASVEGTPERGDYDQALRIVNDFTVSQRLPYGGSVSASIVADYLSFIQQRTLNDDFEDSQRTRVVGTVDIPLLRGAGRSAREDLIQAERDLVYAIRGFERFRREFLVDLATDYFDLLRRQQAIENQRRQLANLEWLYRRFEALAEAGRQPFFQVQRVEQQVLFARNNLIGLIEDYAGALDAFKIRLGMPLSRPLQIVPTELEIPVPALNTVEAVATAHRLRLDLQTSRDLVDDALRQVNVARNQTLADLDLFGELTLRSEGQRRVGGFNLDAGESDYRAGMRLGVPLDRRVEHIRVRQAMIRYERAQRSYALERDRVAQQVRQSIRRIEQARFSLDLQTRNIEVAQRRVRGVLLRLRDLQPREFTDAQDDLLRAQTRRDSAQRDLRVSILNYLLDTDQMRVAGDGRWEAPVRLGAVAPPQAPRMGDLIRDGPADAIGPEQADELFEAQPE